MVTDIAQPFIYVHKSRIAILKEKLKNTKTIIFFCKGSFWPTNFCWPHFC